MKPNTVYVWSTGLERWEEVDLSDEELITFTYLYAKTFGTATLHVYQDSLGRFFGHTFKDSNETAIHSDGYCYAPLCV